MNLQPKKKSETKQIKAKMQVKKSKMSTKNKFPPYTMIVSEGTKTEPIYLSGFVSKINAKYKNLTKKDHIKVYGTGRNTNSLIRFVDIKISTGEWAQYQKFWLVYDKDDFPLDRFDNTQFEAESRKDKCIAVAWSNESIELWFLWHFQEYYSNNGRKQYIARLNKYFEYSKTRKDLYDKLMELGSCNDAKRRAKKAYQEFRDRGITAPSAMVPCTKIFALVEELESYLNN